MEIDFDVRRLRERKGLSQEELARAASLSKRQVQAIEKGEVARPHPFTVRRLREVLEPELELEELILTEFDWEDLQAVHSFNTLTAFGHEVNVYPEDFDSEQMALLTAGKAAVVEIEGQSMRVTRDGIGLS